MSVTSVARTSPFLTRSPTRTRTVSTAPLVRTATRPVCAAITRPYTETVSTASPWMTGSTLMIAGPPRPRRLCGCSAGLLPSFLAPAAGLPCCAAACAKVVGAVTAARPRRREAQAREATTGCRRRKLRRPINVIVICNESSYRSANYRVVATRCNQYSTAPALPADRSLKPVNTQYLSVNIFLRSWLQHVPSCGFPSHGWNAAG